MNPILLVVLEIAKEIVTGLIKDFIQGKMKSAEKIKLEEQVLAEVVKRIEGDNTYLQLIARRVMDEVILISTGDPDLRVTSTSIELAKPVRTPLVNRNKYLNEALLDRLQQLETTVLERRRQLGLPTTAELIVGPVNLSPQHPAGWQLAEKAELRDERRLLVDAANTKPSEQLTRESEELEEKPAASPPGWEKIATNKQASRWSEELRDMQDRIRNRRSGNKTQSKEVSDE